MLKPGSVNQIRRGELTRAHGHLARLAELSQEKDVFLFCQCGPGERCHREILLLEAMARFGAEIGPVFHEYPRYFSRPRSP